MSNGYREIFRRIGEILRRINDSLTFEIPLGWAVTILTAVFLLVPVMWLTGHRGNNTVLSLCLLFAISYRHSPDLRKHTHQAVAKISHDSVRIWRRFGVMTVIALILTALYLIDRQSRNFLDLDWEGSFGTTFAGFLLDRPLLCAISAKSWQAVKRKK